MKTLVWIAVFVLALAAGAVACGKSYSSPTSPTMPGTSGTPGPGATPTPGPRY